MFGDYVFEKTAAQYTKKMMLVDADHLEEKAHYSAVFHMASGLLCILMI